MLAFIKKIFVNEGVVLEAADDILKKSTQKFSELGIDLEGRMGAATAFGIITNELMEQGFITGRTRIEINNRIGQWVKEKSGKS